MRLDRAALDPTIRPQRTAAGEAASPASTYAETGFEDFFQDESETLFRRLCLVTGNRAEAEDVMQDAFLSVYERWERVRSLEDPVGYLYRTAFNAFRKRSRRAAMALRRAMRAPSGDEFAAAESRTIVSAALAKLTPRQRAAVVLTELLEFDSGEAGRILGIKPSTVRALSFQARESIRRGMGPPDE
ncbi:MAG TPA: sigma-70 family RNA polymerase sigma factor [Actinomycetota bacterium]|nr:sigma-70 family RNA polymerase sigma factor [Actinomycetota bacterium]